MKKLILITAVLFIFSNTNIFSQTGMECAPCSTETWTDVDTLQYEFIIEKNGEEYPCKIYASARIKYYDECPEGNYVGNHFEIALNDLQWTHDYCVSEGNLTNQQMFKLLKEKILYRAYHDSDFWDDETNERPNYSTSCGVGSDEIWFYIRSCWSEHDQQDLLQACPTNGCCIYRYRVHTKKDHDPVTHYDIWICPGGIYTDHHPDNCEDSPPYYTDCEYICNDIELEEEIELGPDYFKNPLTVKEKTENSKTKIFPNPNTGNFQLYNNSIKTGLMTIRIFNSMGNTVYSKEINKNEQHLSLNLNLNNISSGLYFYRIYSKDKTFSSGSLIINK